MKKLIVLSLVASLVTLLISFNNKVEVAGLDYIDVRNFLTESNIKEMTESYNDLYNADWQATSIELIDDIYDNQDNHIGYLVIFDEGYLAYNNNMSVLELDTKNHPIFYIQNLSDDNVKLVYDSGIFIYGDITSLDYNTYGDYDTNVFFPLYDQYDNTNFKINSSMVKIPYFKDKHDSSNWGNYEPITFSYAGIECGGALCAMSLMYTIKVNGGVDLTPKQTSWKTLRDELYYYVDYDYDIEYLIDPITLYNGVNEYLDDTFGKDKYGMKAILGVDAYNPSVVYYHNKNASASADFCLRVGHAQEPHFWLFNTYYDIIMANKNNFYYDENDVPILWDENDVYAFYICDQKYRNEMFQFFEGNTLLK